MPSVIARQPWVEPRPSPLGLAGFPSLPALPRPSIAPTLPGAVFWPFPNWRHGWSDHLWPHLMQGTSTNDISVGRRSLGSAVTELQSAVERSCTSAYDLLIPAPIEHGQQLRLQLGRSLVRAAAFRLWYLPAGRLLAEAARASVTGVETPQAMASRVLGTAHGPVPLPAVPRSARWHQSAGLAL